MNDAIPARIETTNRLRTSYGIFVLPKGYVPNGQARTVIKNAMAQAICSSCRKDHWNCRGICSPEDLAEEIAALLTGDTDG